VIDAGVLANDETAQVLQGPDLREPRHRARQAHGKRRRTESPCSRIAEHSGLRVVDRPLDEFHDGLVPVRTGLGVQTERALTVLDPCVQRSAV